LGNIVLFAYNFTKLIQILVEKKKKRESVRIIERK